MSQQTNYNFDFNRAFAGMKSDARFDEVVTGIAEGSIGFGYGVVIGTAQSQVKVPATATDSFRGIALHIHKEQSTAGVQDAQYLDEEAVSVLTQGAVIVPWAGGASPTLNGKVALRWQVSDIGKFQETADANAFITGARLRDVFTVTDSVSGATETLALLELGNEVIS